MPQPLNVLVVSSEAQFIQSIAESLTGAGWQVTLTQLTALDQLMLAIDHAIDVVLCASPAPVTTFNLLTVLGHFRPECPLIVIAQSPDLESAVEALKHGAADYLPADKLYRLPDAVRSALNTRSPRSPLSAAAMQDAESLKILLETVVEGIVVADEEGVITLVNPVGARMFGYEPQELIGQSIEVLMPEPYRSHHMRYVKNYLRTGLSRMVGVPRELMGIHRNGAEFPIEISMSASKMSERYFFVATLRNLTERRQAQEIQRSAERLRLELEHERELRSIKNYFISTITHELRNPLAAIQVMADLLYKYDEQLPHAQRLEKLNAIRQQVARMNALIEDVLLVGEREAGHLAFKPERADLAEFCLQVFKEIEATLGNRHQMFFYGLNSALSYVFDARLLRQALVNLASNAVKYSPAGTKIAMSLHQAAGQIEIRVADEGIGIPAAEQSRLFQAFYRAGNVGSTKGTGLGLSISRQVVELHGGHITFESVEGQGSVFIISLPQFTYPTPTQNDESMSPSPQNSVQ